jgi:hypothetical protein
MKAHGSGTSDGVSGRSTGRETSSCEDVRPKSIPTNCCGGFDIALTNYDRCTFGAFGPDEQRQFVAVVFYVWDARHNLVPGMCAPPMSASLIGFSCYVFHRSSCLKEMHYCFAFVVFNIHCSGQTVVRALLNNSSGFHAFDVESHSADDFSLSS